MTAELPLAVRVCARLLPSTDREAILGDLLEDAEFRDLNGARRQVFLASECGAIAAGLSVTRARAWLFVPPVRELVAGLAVDRSRAFSGGHPSRVVLRAVLFCGSIVTLALGVELLVATLMSAAGF
jgi:hypothetical protein